MKANKIHILSNSFRGLLLRTTTMSTSLPVARQALLDLKIQLSKTSDPSTITSLQSQITTQRALVKSLSAAINASDPVVSTPIPTLTFDTAPTAASTNPLQSGGAYTALLGKQDAMSFSSNVNLSLGNLSATTFEATANLTATGTSTLENVILDGNVSGIGVATTLATASSTTLLSAAAVQAALATKQDVLQSSDVSFGGALTSVTEDTANLTVGGTATLSGPLAISGNVSGTGIGTSVTDNNATLLTSGALFTALASKQDQLVPGADAQIGGRLTSSSLLRTNNFVGTGTSTFNGATIVDGTVTGLSIATSASPGSAALIKTGIVTPLLAAKQDALASTSTLSLGVVTSTSRTVTGNFAVSGTATFDGDATFNQSFGGNAVISTVVASSPALVTSGGLHTALGLKQDAITATSDFTLTSATSAAHTTTTFQSNGDATFSGPVVLSTSTLSGTGISTVATENLAKPITSGGAFSVLTTKQDSITSASNLTVKTANVGSSLILAPQHPIVPNKKGNAVVQRVHTFGQEGAQASHLYVPQSMIVGLSAHPSGLADAQCEVNGNMLVSGNVLTDGHTYVCDSTPSADITTRPPKGGMMFYRQVAQPCIWRTSVLHSPPAGDPYTQIVDIENGPVIGADNHVVVVGNNGDVSLLFDHVVYHACALNVGGNTIQPFQQIHKVQLRCRGLASQAQRRTNLMIIYTPNTY